MVNLDLSAGGDGSNSTTQRRGVVAFNYLTGGGVEFWDGAANRIARFGFTDGTSHNQRAIFDVGVELRADQSVFVGPTNPRPYLFQKTVTGASANPGIGVYVTDSSGTPSSFSHLSASAFYTASDARLKSNIETLEDALAILCRLRGVRFVWDSTGEASVGVIAQEVQTALPEAVGGDPSGDDAYDVLGVTDMPLLAVIIEAVKDLATRVTAIESA